MFTNVLIVGGGPAALEAALALHRLAGDRVTMTLLAPESNLVTTVAGERLAYDVLLVAAGARPLYELALMLAERAYQMGVEIEVHLVTPEPAPLALFGPEASGELTRLLADAKITLHTGAAPEIVASGTVRVAPDGPTIEVDRIVSAPRLMGPSIKGLPADPEGFLVIDAHARVQGVPDVYAAGDVTAFPVKQGGIGCQQADAAAAHIAARAGAVVDPAPFTPVLRGMLLTERWARYMRTDPAETPQVSFDDAGQGEIEVLSLQ